MPQSSNALGPFQKLILRGTCRDKALQRREEQLGEGAITTGEEHLGGSDECDADNRLRPS